MRLGVNIDHVATLRQARGTFEPDPVAAAYAAERGGAAHITIHLREDRRHIQERDLEILSRTVATGLDLEMAATEEMVALARKYKPTFVTLVPEKREELTTEGGLDVAGNRKRLAEVTASLNEGGVPVSMFVEPVEEQIAAAREAGAGTIEIHTGSYANARGPDEQFKRRAEIAAAVRLAASLELSVSVGHGLNYYNVKPIAAISGIEELNIGHSIVARAIFVGLEEATRQMLALMREARGGL
ncbi:MAG: pyridoxine 5'-phosphate synthase [candidate division Zixibacteria bacterium]|nr:pyridoxine 5'-phosphate synthase [candidate division Zixibacteria bacterium]